MTSEAAVRRKLTEMTGRDPGTIDGIPRSPAAEEEANRICRAALTTADGERLMDYLRSITMNVALTAAATDAELRMQEGMRRLVAILDIRRHTEPKQRTE